MTAKDHWTELLTCRICSQSGLVYLSDDGLFNVKVESLPGGFEIRYSAHGQTFFCSNCDGEAITSRTK
jgi:hypothetical protein